MTRTILSAAYPLTEVSPDSEGAPERILFTLDRALNALGYESLVIAAEGSKIHGTLIASPKAAKRVGDSVRDWARRIHRQLIKDVLAKRHVDLIHLHGLDFHCYLPARDMPVLATLHLPPEWYPPEIFQSNRSNLKMNCVSWSQHLNCPASTHLLRPISNGVDVDTLDSETPKGSFAIALGRICPDAGFHFALDAAREAGTGMFLAGEISDSHQKYFKTEIAPRLDKHRKFLGPLRFSKKRRLLSRAKCLIISSTAAETSSLLAMEALACGTPVIAFRFGALPEIIDEGRTGFVVSSAGEMGRALRDVDTLRPETCRQDARSRFSAQIMARAYTDAYERLIDLYASHPAGVMDRRLRLVSR